MASSKDNRYEMSGADKAARPSSGYQHEGMLMYVTIVTISSIVYMFMKHRKRRKNITMNIESKTEDGRHSLIQCSEVAKAAN